MTQVHLTANLNELIGHITSSNLSESIKAMVVVILNAYMEAERDEFIQAAHHERNLVRVDHRNGYYDRELVLSFGKIKLHVPRTRSGEFATTIFEKYSRMEQSLLVGICEAVIQGVSTRKVTEVVEQLYGCGVSKSFVSNVMKRLDPEIEAFQNRPLDGTDYPFVFVDAMYFKQIEDGHSKSKALYIAQATNKDRKREIIGLMVGSEESTANWTKFFQSLKDRGLESPKLIISDAHQGILAAIRQVYLSSPWQRCTVHFLRNLCEGLPKNKYQYEKRLLADIFQKQTKEEVFAARRAFETVVKDNPRFAKILDKLEQGFSDAIQYLEFPEPFWPSIRSTNSLERTNGTIRQRFKIIPLFPNEASAVRLAGSILMDEHDKWQKSNCRFLKTTAEAEEIERQNKEKEARREARKAERAAQGR